MPLAIKTRPALGAIAAASVLAVCGVCGFLASIHGSMNFRVISRIAFPITALATRLSMFDNYWVALASGILSYLFWITIFYVIILRLNDNRSA
jgi:hypothetical protein